MRELFTAELNFLVPPKANRVIRTGKGKAFLPSRISKAIEDAIFILSSLRKETIKKPVEIYVRFILPDRRRRDLDNMMKTLGDCLEKARIIEDDNLIVKETIEKAYSKSKKEGMEIKIYEGSFIEVE